MYDSRYRKPITWIEFSGFMHYLHTYTTICLNDCGLSWFKAYCY